MNKKDADPYVDLIILIGMGEIRNNIIVSMVDDIIIIAGESGTLSEIEKVWRLKKSIVALSSFGGCVERHSQTKIDITRTDMILGIDSLESGMKMILPLMKSP